MNGVTGMDCIVFDIDGTLSDPAHRLHHVSGGSRNWDAFFAGMGEDKLKADIAWLNHVAYNAGITILIATARPSNYEVQTREWLDRHGVIYDGLYMRPEGNHREDGLVKTEMLDRIIADGYRVRTWYDDRTRVTQALRDRGVTVCQVASWDDRVAQVRVPTLTVMVGPSGAGKSTWVDRAAVPRSQVVSSDEIRLQLTGDAADQTQNDAVFLAAHAVTRARIRNGLDVIFDATNLRRKDRLAVVACADGVDVAIRYVVVDRPMTDKLRDRGWRPEWLVEKHDERFKSVVKDVLNGDGVAGIEVVDLRVKEGV